MAAFLMMKYFRYDQRLAYAVIGLLGNQSRTDLLAHLVRERETDVRLSERILHFCRAYSTCRENRNILVHSSVRLKAPMEITGLEKRSKTSIGKTVSYGYDIEKLEHVLAEMTTLLTFASILSSSIYLNHIEPDKPPLSWPRTPPLPSKLIPLPPEDHQGGPPQPQS